MIAVGVDITKVTALANKVQEILCLTDQHDRHGDREVPLVDFWDVIQGRIEDALGIEQGSLLKIYGPGPCNDAKCQYCHEI